MRSFVILFFALLFPFDAIAANWYVDKYSPFTTSTIAGEECRYLRLSYTDSAASYTPSLNTTAITNARFVYDHIDGTGTGANITLKSCTDATNTATCTNMVADINNNGSPVAAALTADSNFLASTIQYLRAQVDVALTGTGNSILEVCGSNQVGPIVEVDPFFKQMNSLAALEAQIGQTVGGSTDISITSTATNATIVSSTGTDGTLNSATASLAGVLSAADKTALDNLVGGVVTSIVAGTNVTISPVGGTGAVTVNSSGGGGGGTAATTTFTPITGNTATNVQTAVANLQSTKADVSSQAAVLVSGQGSPSITTTLNPNDADNNGTPTDTLACSSTTCFFQGSDRSLWFKVGTTGFHQWQRLDREWSKEMNYLGSYTSGVTENPTPIVGACLRWWDAGKPNSALACTSRQATITLNRTTIVTGYRILNDAGNVTNLEGARFWFSNDSGSTQMAGLNWNIPSTNVVGPFAGTTYSEDFAAPFVLPADTYVIQPTNGQFCQNGDGGSGTSTPSTDCVFDGGWGWGIMELIGYQLQ